MSSTPDRIAELETRLEFQDETLARLNDELVLQQQRVFQLDKTLKLLINQLQEKSLHIDHSIADPEDETPPPHY